MGHGLCFAHFAHYLSTYNTIPHLHQLWPGYLSHVTRSLWPKFPGVQLAACCPTSVPCHTVLPIETEGFYKVGLGDLG